MPPGGRPHIAFAQSRAIHFARFAILTDPDRGPDRARLLYASVYDGTPRGARRRAGGAVVRPRRDLGTGGGLHRPRRFAAFLRRTRTNRPPTTSRSATRRRSSIQRRSPRGRRSDAARDAGTPITDAPSPASFARMPPRSSALSAPRRSSSTSSSRSRGTGSPTSIAATLRILACLDRYPFFRLVNRLTCNALPAAPLAVQQRRRRHLRARRRRSCPATRSRPILASGFREDVVSQNQLTLVTVIQRRPHQPRARGDVGDRCVREAAGAARIAHRHQHDPLRALARDRRWPAADDGERLRRLVGELHRRVRGDDPVGPRRDLGNRAVGFPPDGARDLPAFKRFLRSHQVPAEVFFSAYPRETVLNIAQRPRARRGAGTRAWMTRDVTASLADDARSDIQGFITSGYGHLPVGGVSLRPHRPIQRPAAGGSVTRSRRSRPPRRGPETRAARPIKPAIATNVAFTADGLARVRTAAVRAVHVSGRVPGRDRVASAVAGFSVTPRRARRRRGSSARPDTEPIHAVLIIHARDEDALDAACAAELSAHPAHRTAVSLAVPAPASAATVRAPTRNHSGSTTASRSRRSPASPATACQPASSSSAIPITTTSSRRRPSFQRARSPRPAASFDNPYHGADALARPRPSWVVRRLPQAAAARGDVLASAARRDRPAARCRRRPLHDLAGVEDGRPLAERRAARGGAAPRRPDACDERCVRVRRRSERPRLPDRRAHPPRASARRSQAVSRRAVASHVRSAPAAAPRARLRPAAVRSGAPSRRTQRSTATPSCRSKTTARRAASISSA